jgi:hypothetical protein
MFGRKFLVGDIWETMALPKTRSARRILCDIDGDLSQYDDFDIFPERCSGALLVAALRLIAAGGWFFAPHNTGRHESSKDGRSVTRDLSPRGAALPSALRFRPLPRVGLISEPVGFDRRQNAAHQGAFDHCL